MRMYLKLQHILTRIMSQPLAQPTLDSSPTHAVPAANAFVARVDKMHVVLGALALVAALVLTHDAPLGSSGHWSAVLAGLLLGGGNFRVLAFLTTRMLLSAEPSTRNSAILMLVMKLGVLAMVMLAVFRWVHPDGVTLILAMSLAPFCLVVEAVRRGGRLDAVAHGSLS